MTQYQIAIRYNAATSVGPGSRKRRKSAVLRFYAQSKNHAEAFATTRKDYPEAVVTASEEISQ